MQYNLIISGVGGQGIITIANILGLAAIKDNLHAKQSEIHGMSQRGGAVETHVRIADHTIFSDQIPKGKANMILAMEPMESLRHLPWLSSEGWLITHDQPVLNVPAYPDIQKIRNEIQKIPHHIIFNAEEMAVQSGSVKSTNLVLLGVSSYFIPVNKECIRETIKYFFRSKENKIIESNLCAYDTGLAYMNQMFATRK